MAFIITIVNVLLVKIYVLCSTLLENVRASGVEEKLSALRKTTNLKLRPVSKLRNERHRKQYTPVFNTFQTLRAS